ncbi:dGTPase [Chitinivorax tropicus]|uniref:dGTPase n=2 Tax=Chitinivorax tropicus TaxID=714531 RepID=A0A840MI90_9PROT|nr:dGTPase [Chitinivorax tropicus]
MTWTQLLSAERLGNAKPTGQDAGRTDFHKDHDRIVFSSAFRRLGRKTQVHPMSENDHVHTRLTHSIEVAAVGRSLGVMAGQRLADKLPTGIVPTDLGAIVQSACLAHDIGNPPFGHAGEYAIRDWFCQERNQPLIAPLTALEQRDLQTFEGNAHGFRVVTQLENHRFAGGLRLTYATLGALLKYPWTVEHAGNKEKFSCYQSELPQLEIIAAELGLIEISHHRWARHPLSYLMEAADDICYAILDLEDGIEIGVLSYEQVEPILVELIGDCTALREELCEAPTTRRKISLLRGKAIQRLVNAVALSFAEHHDLLLAGELTQDLLVTCPRHIVDGLNEAKRLARAKIFNTRQKVEIEVGAYTTLEVLLETFLSAVYQLKTSGSLSFRAKRTLDLMEHNVPDPSWPLYLAYMRVLDFIGGMTDNYAGYLARQVGGLTQ